MMTNEIACADTNVFARALTRDDPLQTQAALNLLQKTKTGEMVLIINDVILIEIMWVLNLKRYGLSRETVSELVGAVLNTDGIMVRSANLGANISEALQLYLDYNIGYTDAYIGSWMKHNELQVIYTFNAKHFNKIPGIVAKTPE